MYFYDCYVIPVPCFINKLNYVFIILGLLCYVMLCYVMLCYVIVAVQYVLSSVIKAFNQGS